MGSQAQRVGSYVSTTGSRLQPNALERKREPALSGTMPYRSSQPRAGVESK
jgi:hypothetical protein